MFMRGPSPPPAAVGQPWRLPPSGLAVFHGERHAPRLSHYFLPRLALEGKRILFLDGANCADPRLMARLAERRGLPFPQFNRQIMLARAFTCFQLTELICRVPQFLAKFPAQAVIVTAFPELYFDEDVRQSDAAAAFQQALECLAGGWGLGAGDWGLEALPIGDWRLPIAGRNSKREKAADLQNRSALPRAAARVSNSEFRFSAFPQHPAPRPQPLAVTVALFSAASGFQPPAGRTRFFAQTCAAATELWKFQADGQGRLSLTQQDKRESALPLASGAPDFEFRIARCDSAAQHPAPGT